MAQIQVDQILDCKGLACPMPIVRTKKAIEELKAGQVIEIQATDKGSLADLQAWAKHTGHQFLGTATKDHIFRHFIRKSNPSEVKDQLHFPRTITNQALEQKLMNHEAVTILDVREPAEFAFHRIPKSISIPLGELERQLDLLSIELFQKDDPVYVICRTGTRSDLACHILARHGFTQVNNVLPGMSAWSGPTERD
ncbi:rhodanese-related sulfurtransferase/TusA-related sulfurtransferase [Paenibacillus shirakamiensis]|uniref:Rhodanese-related sulfurtransferase/TusA-related sulfurtransferase n=1 Tax=Paenibacillus shirakamiensis TaxID=1265935 RepID=A0ABS4JGC1_9BACL|nr:sulfurtransferase TusA family protein [Paenibacillus shirakamiensis]MBP2000146.1 rhodanese-related sulfurtransferase/TusA-related sulfurtransferase [Paenibacillus shirakamiensis]